MSVSFAGLVVMISRILQQFPLQRAGHHGLFSFLMKPYSKDIHALEHWQEIFDKGEDQKLL